MIQNNEPKIGDVIKYKGHELLVCKDKLFEQELGNNCSECFFYFDNYPIQLSKLKVQDCYKPFNYKCDEDDNKNSIYFKKLNEIEALILKERND